MSKSEKPEKIEPIRLTDTETGKIYTLEFSRKSIERMERQGFIAGDVVDKPLTTVPMLFYGAFYMHQPYITKDQTDKILYDLGEIPGLLGRLCALYNEPVKTLFGIDDDGENERKNSRYTTEL